MKECQEMNVDSSSTLYECIVLSKFYFGDILSYTGFSELAYHVMSVDWSLCELEGS